MTVTAGSGDAVNYSGFIKPLGKFRYGRNSLTEKPEDPLIMASDCGI